MNRDEAAVVNLLQILETARGQWVTVDATEITDALGWSMFKLWWKHKSVLKRLESAGKVTLELNGRTYPGVSLNHDMPRVPIELIDLLEELAEVIDDDD